MRQVAVIFVIGTICAAKGIPPLDGQTKAQDRHDENCNCDSIGPWQPLFRPSPILHSELPEHHRHPLLGIYSSRSDLKLVPHILVPVVNPVAYTLHQDVVRPGLKYSLLDTSITESTDSNGKPIIKWDHYGDIKQISLKFNGVVPKNKKNNNALFNHKLEEDLNKNKLTESHVNEGRYKQNEKNKDESGPCVADEEDERYFNSGSFFDNKINSQETLEIQKDVLKEEKHSSEIKSQLHKESTKMLDSYPSISLVKSPYSSVFTSVDGKGNAHFVHHGDPAWLIQSKPQNSRGESQSYKVYEKHPDVGQYGRKEFPYSYEDYLPLQKDYSLGDFWKNTRVGKMLPPSLGQKSSWLVNTKTKKPRKISFNRDDLMRSNRPFSYVYIIKTKKNARPLFISH
uniref:Uncharacterized protein n=1 Tax=Clastoptera arizonana TaxID=38151 RepID=A0A1B6C8R3_9HEMI